MAHVFHHTRMAKLMHEQQRKHIKQLRRRIRRDSHPYLMIGFTNRMQQKIRTQQYEILRTEKANRREQQRRKQEQERVRIESSASPWCGWCN